MRVKFGNATITLKAIPHLESVNVSSETEYAYSAAGEKIMEFERNRNLGIDMKFSAVRDGDALMQMTMN